MITVPRTLPNDTIWHSYMMDWDYSLYIKWADVITNMATYPMMHTTDGTECETCSWVKDKPGQLTEKWNTPLTPAYRYINKTVCDPSRHTVEQWCGLEGLVDDMLAAGVSAPKGQLSPGMCKSSSLRQQSAPVIDPERPLSARLVVMTGMNECHITAEFPRGITDQGWTQPSLRQFLDFLDVRGVRSIDMWTGTFPDVLGGTNFSRNPPGCPSPCPANPSCPWFVTELERWMKTG